MQGVTDLGALRALTAARTSFQTPFSVVCLHGGMIISPSRTVFESVREHPSVKAAQARVDKAQARLDRADAALHGTWDTRNALYDAHVSGLWKQKVDVIGGTAAYGVFIGAAGGAVLAARVASLVPGLAPLSGLISIGAFIAGMKHLPKAVARYVVAPLTKRSVNREMDVFLSHERRVAQDESVAARKTYDATLQHIINDMARQTAEAQVEAERRSAAQPGIEMTPETVNLGGVSIQRRRDVHTPSGAETQARAIR